jgi:hypothetical protein
VRLKHQRLTNETPSQQIIEVVSNEMGRPSTFADEIFDQICDRLADGQTLSQICRDPQMPDRETVKRWTRNDDGRRRQYDMARQDGMDALADTIVDISWDTSNDTTTTERGTAVANHEWIARSRLKVDTIKFLMSKINPARYGDKLPEAIQARQIEAEEQQAYAAASQITKIERIILEPVTPGDMVQDANGDWVPNPNGNEHLHRQIAELKAELAGKSPAPPKPPALLEYDPGLPRRMDQDIARRMVALIRDCVPVDGRRDPAAVLDECLTVIRNALHTHFGPAGEIIELMPATD